MLKEFRSIERVCTATEHDLKKVNKIGKKKAKQIRGIITKYYEDR